MSNEQVRLSQTPTRIAAAVMFLMLVVAGYAISPSVESAVDSAPVTVTALTPSFDAAQQWTGYKNLDQRPADEEVRQRFVGAEEHIQAF